MHIHSSCLWRVKHSRCHIILAVLLLISLLFNFNLAVLNNRQDQLIQKLSSRLSESGIWIDDLVFPDAFHQDSSYVNAGNLPSKHSRVLASSGSANSGSSGGSHESHQSDALLYLFNAFFVGAGVMQLSARFPILQQTVVLFMLGFTISLFLKTTGLIDDIGVFGDSYKMWMGIDPHLLLFTLLPALLAGDAMTIDTSVARRVGLQCLYLAGPGVLIAGMTTAAFLTWYLDWPFLLSLCAGAIMCATDPVAVVALLKELGASPMLTVQIQGESLLNDGTAIVLYLISYNMLSGEEYDAAGIAMFLVKKAMMAWALGLFIGYFFYSWIRAASNKLNHSSSMIQITLTLCCAYWSYIFVEGVLQLSGVLATVASSLVLAHHMWPHIVCESSMMHVWHTFESLGNIIIFFLAGSITGWIAVDIEFVDYLHLIVIYVFLFTVRGCLLFASRPLLKVLSKDGLPVSWQDATLMTWGGLRGAVGLALAIQVNNDRASDDKGEPQIFESHAKRLLFFISGIAFLTTILNATTAPWLVQKLGIVATTHARRALLKMFYQQLLNESDNQENPCTVNEALRKALEVGLRGIEHQNTETGGPMSARHARSSDIVEFEDGHQSNEELLKEFELHRTNFEALEKSDLALLGDDLPENLLGKVDEMKLLMKDQWVDEGMSKIVNQIFLNMVQRNYWKQIEDGHLRPGSPECDALMTSVRLSLSPYRTDLKDFGELNIGKSATISDWKFSKTNDTDEVATEIAALGHIDGVSNREFRELRKSCLGSIVPSWQFNMGIAIVILLNSFQVIAEELFQNEDNDKHLAWLLLDATFTFIFFMEFALKFAWLQMRYFQDNWNIFDFFLVVIGIAGLIVSIITHNDDAELAGETRIVRVARVLRTLRFLRVFRLLHARLSADKFVSGELAQHMKKIMTLSCFIRAHLQAQLSLVKYFGGNGKIDEVDECELARCILQSQVSTYKALTEAAHTQHQLGPELLKELETLYKRKKITEDLSSFVLEAHRDGAISSFEAHKILHPLHDHVAECMYTLNQRTDGVLDRSHSYRRNSDSNTNYKRPSLSPSAHSGGDMCIGDRKKSSGDRSEGSLMSVGNSDPAMFAVLPNAAQDPGMLGILPNGVPETQGTRSLQSVDDSVRNQ